MNAGTAAAAGVLRVAHLQRKPLAGYFSIEGQFEEIRTHMPPGYSCEPWICPEFSKGVLPRLRNAKAASRVNADVWHVTGDVHYLTYHLPRKRTLLTVHDCVFLHQTSGLRRWLLKKMFYDWALPHAGLVTVISQATRRELISLTGIEESRVRLVPCCVSATYTFSQPRAWPAEPLVLIVGTKPNKNVPRMLKALAGSGCAVHIVGELDAPLRAALQASSLRWRNSPKLDQSGMVAAYRECDMLAFASTYEGFGLPIVEAQAVGRPVLTSNAASMPEASGGAAVLVDPLSTTSMGEGFRRMFADSALRNDLVMRGRANSELYNSRRVALLYASIYDELAAGPSPRESTA